MTQNMSTVRYIRIAFMMLALFMGAASGAWALNVNDISTQVLPAAAKTAGCEIQHIAITEGRKVSFEVVPATGSTNYYIRKEDIHVQKLVDPNNVTARTKAPGIADYLDVDGPNIVLASSTNKTYTFTLPEGYEGAYIEAEFKVIGDGLIMISSGMTSVDWDPSGHYILMDDISASVVANLHNTGADFTGFFEGEPKADGTFPRITGLTKPLFVTTDGAKIKNVMLTGVNITTTSYTGSNVGALVGEAKGNTRIYNCGIIPASQSNITKHYDDKKHEVVIDGFTGNYIGGGSSANVGSLVGKLTGGTDQSPRVINCFSYATLTGGGTLGGIVGNIGYDTNGTITQSTVTSKGMVMNCMFYGDKSSTCPTISPVYGGASGAMIKNNAVDGVNSYNYFRKNADFDNGYGNISAYRQSWPAEEKNLTRFEYYRSILNSNRRLCTWWVEGTDGTAATDAKVEEVGIAKWVLDPGIAPYPILKKWGLYPSVINRNKTKVWKTVVNKSATPDANGKYTYTIDETKTGWVDRDGTNGAAPYEGKKLGTINVNINPGAHAATGLSEKKNVPFIITDIDTLNHDYGYYKIQLPYYNKEFGDSTKTDWDQRYGGNYKEYVVTGWEITVSGGTTATNYNFADRKSTNGRIFAQGGYYYVPEGVTDITITAHWGKAVYLANRNFCIDNVNLTKGGYKAESGFTPAGTIAGTISGLTYNSTERTYTFQGQNVYNDWQEAIKAVPESADGVANTNVYNNAIVLISNHQVKNGGSKTKNDRSIGWNLDSKWHSFTMMSADFDLDNEPDFCFQLQYRDNTDRPSIQPVRFDFLPIVELGLAVRHDKKAYAIGIFVPEGHFEITETAFMHTTQFEYDGLESGKRVSGKSPMIVNGGEHEMFTIRKHSSDRTSYFLLGGNVWIHRFAPGFHPTPNPTTIKLYVCPVNVIGGDIKELYLSGLYRPDYDVPRNSAGNSIQGDPFCYTSGGHFGIMAGAGYDKISGDVTFKIDHSVIGEFYGGGINATNPIGGKIDVTINNSLVDKYCGGPKVGSMAYDDNGTTKYKTVTTHAKGTTFGVFYGGGNGGNSYYRQLQKDGDENIPDNNIISSWTNWSSFYPLNIGATSTTAKYDDGSEANLPANTTPTPTKIDNKGYHAEYEFEVFTHSNGVTEQITQRGFIKWIQFGITDTGDVTNILEDCIINTNFYGGGNLATVQGNVKSKLTDTSVKGSVFGAGFSASVPTFKVHDKSKIGTDDNPYPFIDNSGTLTDGEVGYGNTVYEWTNKIPDSAEGSTDADKVAYMKTHPTYTEGGKNYCYTWNSLDNLGAVIGNAELEMYGNTCVEGYIFDDNGNLTANQTGGAFGGGDASSVSGKATVTINTPSRQTGKSYNVYNVFGGGNSADVGEQTKVELTDGIIGHNVYGGGNVGSVGTLDGDPVQHNSVKTERYEGTTTTYDGAFYDFGLSWPVKFTYTGAATTETSIPDNGKSTVLINKGTINGDVYGGSKGKVDVKDANDAAATITNQRYLEASVGNVRNAIVTIGTTTGGASDVSITGSVYGGGEDGHVNENAWVTINNGEIGQNVFGAGRGEGTYTATLFDPTSTTPGTEKTTGEAAHSWTAGKVYGNTYVTMNNGSVGYNIYGGGNLASVGKGNYAGGHDDYSQVGYGELPEDDDANLWTLASTTDVTSDAYMFLNSGKTFVNIYGGTIGTASGADANSFPYGNVFGSSKGMAAKNANQSPRYRYVPDFFLGYVNETTVHIGDPTKIETVGYAGPTIHGSVYGGGQDGHVRRHTSVNINKGYVGGTSSAANSGTDRGNVFGAGSGMSTNVDGLYNTSSGSVTCTTTVNINAGAKIYQNVYGGGAQGSVGPPPGGVLTNETNAATDTKKSYSYTKVNINGGYVGDVNNAAGYGGNVFGASRGNSALNQTLYATDVYSMVNVNSGTILDNVFGGGEAGNVKMDVKVNILGGSIGGDVYGGGALAKVNTASTTTSGVTTYPTTTVNLLGGSITGDAYGGGLGDRADGTTAHSDVEADAGNTKVNLNGLETGDYDATIHASYVQAVQASATSPVKYYELKTGTAGSGSETVKTYAKGATVSQVFGANNKNGSPKGNVNVHVFATQNKATGMGTIINKYNPPYCDPKKSDDEGYKDYLQRVINAAYKKDADGTLTTAVLDGVTASKVNDAKTLLNTTLAGVTEANLTDANKTSITTAANNIISEFNNLYDVQAVYGGGNEADYKPDANPDANNTPKSTKVIIEGCDYSSIQYVYGGGNAAAVPAAEVQILGAKIIDNVFGGGNGERGAAYAAHVGYYRTISGTTVGRSDNYYDNIGDGTTNTKLVGGNIHNVYGGSNSNGDIRGGANTSMLQPSSFLNNDCCDDLVVQNLYGGGKNADMSSGTSIVLGCMPNSWIEDIYAGSREADVGGNVSLTITSGLFERVFGGNKTSGIIKGSITVNIEETTDDNCGTPIVIGELYGGGNQAGYSVYGYEDGGTDPVTGKTIWTPRTKAQYDALKAQIDGKTDAEIEASTTLSAIKAKLTGLPYADPLLNVRAFTSIGAIYGGGFEAFMAANPTVGINVVKGSHASDASLHTGSGSTYPAVDNPTTPFNNLPYPKHTSGAIGAIGNVFGGGNLATVDGNTTVNIGTETQIGFMSPVTHLTAITGTGTSTVPAKYTVEGAYITGNVYGGGNQADVTGNTQVNICAKYNKTTEKWEDVAEGASKVKIDGDVFGAGKGVASDVTLALVHGSAGVGMAGGEVKKSVYGGGELSQVGTNTNVTVVGGKIGTEKSGTTVYGGATYGNVYGGGKGNTSKSNAGLVKGNTNVIIGEILADATYAAAHDGVNEGDVVTTPTILHNIYGGGAYGSVGDFTFTTGAPSAIAAGGGTANVTITGGTIGTDGHENGMIFGSSRGDVATPVAPSAGADPVDPNDKLAWVNNANVTIGTSNATTGPQIKGSIYGSGENGHVYNNTDVKIYSGTIGITGTDNVTIYDLVSTGTESVLSESTTTDPVYTGKPYNYPYRGNVYGGGCGTDKYPGTNNYNPLAGIVRGTASVTMSGGTVIHNVYGAGAMGSVGETNATGAIISGGATTIAISGGTVGVDGSDNGNVFGAARGDENAPKGLAQVKSTGVTISGTTTGTIIKGNVYGGGALGDVGTYTYNSSTKAYTWDKIGTVETGDCHVTINGGTIEGYVYGAGKGVAHTFECEKALVRTTDVNISAGTVNYNVYGGGELGRVDQDTKVTLGGESGTSGGEDAIIGGEVFGAGKGLETHGYSALVRGNSEVIVQGNAKVGGSVYGGGEIAAVGRYRLDENEMPTALVSGGECKVTVKGYAVVGQSGTGNVFGAGKGVNPSDATHTYIDFTSTNKAKWPKRMTLYTNATDFPADATTGTPTATPNGSTWEYYEAGSPYVWEYYKSQDTYFKFLQTLALATDTKVSIEGNATVKNNVYGGSESGFVQRDTDVKIKGGTIGTTGSTTDGNIFGGGKGLDVFAEAGRVRGNATVAISNGNIAANVYGGGELGHVGSFTETTDGRFDMVKIKDKEGEDMDTGLCTVTITGGKVGSDSNTDSKKGNVFGAGKGKDDTFKCEKAMVLNTSVSINTGAVNGDVFGGGEIGRVEYNSQVTMGSGSVKRSIYGGGAGVETHGYSALVRGNTTVTIEGGSVGESVYGGGEIASVGRYGLDAQKMPSILLGGGYCYVTVKGSATIGSATEAGDVFGAGKGVVPHFDKDNAVKANRSRRMTVYNADEFPESAKISTTSTATAYEGSIWEYYDESVTPKLVWEYFQDETKYNDYLETLALATHPEVNIDGDSHVYGSVFGGGELGITKGSVFVNILGGTIEEDVYGGGSLANTNTTSSIGKTDPDTGAAITDSDGNIELDEDIHPTTTVNLLGGHIKGDAYGGGLGQLDLPASDTQPAVPAIEAKVYGDVKVNLNGLQSADDINATTLTSLTSGDKLEADGTAYQVKSTVKGCAVTRIFGCNNLNGSPQKKVQVYVFGTQSATTGVTQIANAGTVTNAKVKGRYDVAAVYGGGNLSPYVPEDALLPYTDANKAKVDAARPEVYIDGCDRTSIQQVYGGGNAASAPATFVRVDRCYEIDEVFGGGNGFDNYTLDERGQKVYYENSGANVGYYTGYYTNYATYSTYAKRTSGGGSVTSADPGTSANPYKAVVNSDYAGDADKKTARLAATDIQYGSGIATLEVKGGTVHTAFGGSNSKGNVRTKLASLYSAAFDDCTMAVDKSYGGGKNAYSDADAEVNADCAKGVKVLFGGSENADFDGNIDMHITNGSSLEKVFGGNNTSGAVNGSITITLEEGGCEPIHIDELYLGGFLAPYSVYGYKKTNGVYDTEDVEYIDDNNVKQTKKQRIPLQKDDIGALATPYKDPRINVISATYIGDIFGGGYQAKLVGNPHINVNMTTGFVKVTKTEKGATDTSTDPNEFTEGGKTYMYKDVAGNTYNKDKVGPDPAKPTELIATTAIGTIGNIYGGGNMADIIGDTYVEIGTGTQHNAAGTELVTISPARNAAHITGDVYGGGKGVDDSFFCDKAMVGKEGDGVDHPDGGTHVTIGNGTVDGNVYGGGMIGRVEKNTVVTIGLENAEAGTSSPLIKGSVFGGGKGKETHGYAALVRGNPTVTIQADAKVEGNVYGGGEIASVARYNVPKNEDDVEAAIAAGYDAHLGMPYALANDWSGNCNVTVRDNAEIGPNGMKMYHEGEADDKPDDKGHVFGAGKGILPKIYDYDPTDKTTMPRRMVLYDDEVHTTANSDYWEYVSTTDHVNVWEYFPNEEKYFEFIQTLALASKTKVTIGGEGSDPFIKGSVYGGSENGLVQFDTEVKIQSGQIGAGDGVNVRYTAAQWESEDPTVLKECASWEYKAPYAPYDPNANATVDLDKYPLVTGQTEAKSTEGGRRIASDGHTYYGNVFGGGSGSVPYFDTKQGISKYLSSAGTVKGNTKVEITGGHILTNVYGGCEATNVLGKATVKMTGGTIGVPRDPEMILKHPVVCNLFGAGKGDQRIFFNKETNVNDVEVEIDGGRIYGSVFGGGEDGHVLRDVTLTIKETSATKPTTIGSTGTTYMDGNVFGGGRGFGGDALTAGNVGGSITVNMEGGTLLGSLYGGGRLASVGYGLYLSTGEEAAKYGQMRADDEYDGSYPNPSKLTAAEYYKNGRGYITVNIKGGTIGNGSADAIHSGNVFGASMGRLTKLDNTTANDIWPLMATAKKATVNITNGIIQRNVYGGGEMGRVTTDTKVNIEGGTINGSVFGGGYGSDDYTKYVVTDAGKTYRPILFAGRVEGNTNIEATKGTVKGNVYGGGEMATVGLIENVFDLDKKDADEKYIYRHDYPEKAGDGALYSFGLSWPYQFDYDQNTGLATIEIKKEAKVEGHVFGAGKGKIELGETDITKHRFVEALIANVRATQVTIGETTGDTQPTISNSVYGGGEDGHVYEDASIIINNGTIAHSVFGAGKGESTFAGKRREAQVNPADPADLSLYTDVDDPKIHSWIAGKVFGNTFITMNGGSVGYNIYGGGNLASIGKGNYAGGQDDYSTVGYGELPLDDNSNIWTSTFKPDEAVSATNKPDFAYHFTSSGKATITINSGTVGTAASATAAEIYGNVFGSSRGKAAFDVGRRSPRFKYVPDFYLGYVNDTEITIGSADASYTGSAPVIKGSVYGGGQDGHVRRSTKVTINKGTIGDYTGLSDAQKKEVGNVFGAGSGMGKYDSNGDGTVDAYNNSSGSVTCTTRVDIKPGVTVIGSVYGGGAMGSVGPPNTGQGDETNTPTTTHMSSTSTLVNIEGGNISGSVYGSSRGDADLEKQYPHTYATNLWSTVNMSDGNVGGSVFGGGEAGNVKCDVDVEISGGNIAGDVYGGGALARTNTSNWTYNASSKTWGTTWAAGKYLEPTSTMPIYHTTYKTTVNLKGGTINGNVYGGGLGRKAEGTDPGVEAKVYGDVLVTLNGTKTTTTSGTTTTDAYNDNCKVKGAVFGCNNLNGSPQSAVTVHVYKTQGYDDSHTKSAGKDASTFDLAAVYGGGNQAAFMPDLKATADTVMTHVIIEGCDRTSIKQVYGGGNAASAPATNVTVKSAYEIEELFGGGNGYGFMDAANTIPNPGANVGFKDYHLVEDTYNTKELRVETAEFLNNYVYGSGKASLDVYGGRIHRVFGGSNTKGNVRETAITMLDNQDACTLEIDEVYGGGKSAPMDAEAKLLMACIPGLNAVYGGAQEADIQNNVELNITNGTFNRVFGGNNISGTIRGSITVNIEETGCQPIIIGELYGGGNLAGYSVYGYNDDKSLKQTGTTKLYHDPVVNVKSFTSIGNIYGGGYGESAVMVGDPTVNISVALGDKANEDAAEIKYGVNDKTPGGFAVPTHEKGQIGAINNVFGGGNAAKVVGNTNVNIGTLTEVYVTIPDNDIKVGVTDVQNFYKRTGAGTAASPYVYTQVNGPVAPATTVPAQNGVTYYKKLSVQGADIRGNVYGGGNAADVSGKTNVVVGKED